MRGVHALGLLFLLPALTLSAMVCAQSDGALTLHDEGAANTYRTILRLSFLLSTPFTGLLALAVAASTFFTIDPQRDRTQFVLPYLTITVLLFVRPIFTGIFPDVIGDESLPVLRFLLLIAISGMVAVTLFFHAEYRNTQQSIDEMIEEGRESVHHELAAEREIYDTLGVPEGERRYTRPALAQRDNAPRSNADAAEGTAEDGARTPRRRVFLD